MHQYYVKTSVTDYVVAYKNLNGFGDKKFVYSCNTAFLSDAWSPTEHLDGIKEMSLMKRLFTKVEAGK